VPFEEDEWYEQEGAASPEDLVNVGTQVIGPPPSSFAPEGDTEPQRETDATAGNGDASEIEEPLPEFDPKHRQDFEGLLYLGRLTHEFEWLGHKFLIRTLAVDETLEIGLVTQPYNGTVSEPKAYQAAVVAACVVKVDGKPMPVPLSDDPGDSALLNRMETVKRWFPPTLDKVYEEFMLLEDRVVKVLDAMGKVNG
jgi:hypothetical protein